MVRKFVGAIFAGALAFLAYGVDIDGGADRGSTGLQRLDLIPQAHAQITPCTDPDDIPPDDDGDECGNPDYQSQVEPAKNLGGKDPDCLLCQLIGDPINYMTGSFYQEETDYSGSGPDPIAFKRYFNSQDTGTHEFGLMWHSAYSRRIAVPSGSDLICACGLYITKLTPVNGSKISAARDDARVFTYTYNNGTWTSPADVNSRLTQTATGWQYVTARDEVEIYNAAGQLLSITNRAGITQTFGYDAQGRLSSVTDPSGRILQLTYASASSTLIASIIRPDGLSVAYSYDSSNRLTGVTDPNGGTRQYLYENATYPAMLTGIIDENGSRYLTVGYDANGLAISSQHAGGADLYSVGYYFSTGLVNVTNPLGATSGYVLEGINGSGKAAQTVLNCSNCYNQSGVETSTFDTNGNVSSIQDTNGNTTSYTFDTARNLETSRTLSSGEVISTTYSSSFRLPMQVSEPGRTTNFTYDTLGNLLSKSVAPATGAARVWSWTYNTYGEPLTATDPNGNTASYTYDASGDLTAVTNALGQVTQISSYDANGRPLTTTDPNGTTTTLTYNFRGQVLTSTTGVRVTQYAYDPVGQLTKLTKPDGSFLTFAYDAAHRMTGVTDAIGNYIVYTLDAAGNRTQEQVFSASGTLIRTHSDVYDGFNRKIQDIGAANQTTYYNYDLEGNLSYRQDPNNNSYSYSYDTVYRPTAVSAAGQQTNYTYDALNRLATVTDGRGLVTSYGYNILDEQNSLTSPDTGQSTKTYFPAGNVHTTTDGNGKTITYAYDALNRVTQMITPSGAVFAYQYDQGTNGIGHLTTMSDGAGTTTWGYNRYGQVNLKTQTYGGTTLTTRYGYTAATGLLASTSYPSGVSTSYSYNANGQVSGINYTQPGGATSYTLVANVAWKPFGPVKAWTMGNGASYARTFDQDYRIATISMPASLSLAFGYDANSNINGINESGQPAQTFYYDGLNRLTQYYVGNGSQSYTYDYQSGNRTSLYSYNGVGATNITYNYDTQSNHLLSLSGDFTESIAYDAAGNTTQYATPSATENFNYNSRNRLNQVLVNGVAMNYIINAMGQRVTKTPAGGLPTFFNYGEDGQIIGRYNPTIGYEETVYIGGIPVGLFEPGNVYYVAPDQLGAPHQITDGGANVVWQWEHDPFGNGVPAATLTTYHGRFPGQFYDGEDGLNYNYFRDYDPTTGRYTESDPIGLLGGINTYAYVGGSPVDSFDTTGTTVLLEPPEGSPGRTAFDIFGLFNDLGEMKHDISSIGEGMEVNRILDSGNFTPDFSGVPLDYRNFAIDEFDSYMQSRYSQKLNSSNNQCTAKNPTGYDGPTMSAGNANNPTIYVVPKMDGGYLLKTKPGGE